MILKDLIKSWDKIEPENLIFAWDIQDVEIMISFFIHMNREDDKNKEISEKIASFIVEHYMVPNSNKHEY